MGAMTEETDRAGTDRELTGRHVVVVGAARSGLAAVELLVARGAHVTLSERREHLDDAERLRSRGVSIELGGHLPGTFTRADLIVVSPGVRLDQPAFEAARRANVPIVGELEFAWRFLRGRVIAVTGTKGKSTTTTLVGLMLEKAGRHVRVGGNIGLALSAQVSDSTPETLHVVEASSFQLETTESFRPWIAVLLNFSPDHLDRHPSVEAYAAAKARIFQNQRPEDWAVVNADDPFALALAARGVAAQRRFALRAPLSEGIVLAGDAIVERTSSGDAPLVPLSAVRLLGRHLLSDVLAAAAVARIAGVPPEDMAAAVGSFGGLEHALEPVADIRGVRFVNDTKATNVEAARLAIESFDGGVVVILGGRFKGGDFRDLRDALRGRADGVIAIGESRARIREALGDLVPIREAGDMAEAVRVAFAAARPGGTVLLAPACASFDMFRDYAERGRVFKAEVWRLEEEERARRER
jgi:UDP-N-acetylmuramoylalanine--D-glutamate ligase